MRLQQQQMKRARERPPKEVRLNVGGYYYTTTEEVLTNINGSFFHTLINSRLPNKDSDGCYSIEEGDGRLFAYILNYMRDRGDYHAEFFPSDKDTLREIYEQADFYSLTDLKNKIGETIDDLGRKGLKRIGTRSISYEYGDYKVRSVWQYKHKHSKYISAIYLNIEKDFEKSTIAVYEINRKRGEDRKFSCDANATELWEDISSLENLPTTDPKWNAVFAKVEDWVIDVQELKKLMKI